MKTPSLSRWIGLACCLTLLAGCAPAATPTPAATLTPLPPTPAPDPGSIAWTYATGGAIWGTPAIQDGIAYVGSDDNQLHAVDLATGQARWKFATGGFVRSTPAFDGSLVYAASDDGAIYAVDVQTGQKAWSADIGSATTREVLDADAVAYDYVQSSPVVDNGMLYIGSANGQVYALDAATGSQKWSYQTGAAVRASAVVADGTVYIGSWDGFFYALDAATGEVKWKYDTAPTSGPPHYFKPIQSKPVIVGDLVICASRKASVFALDAASGELKWEHSYGRGMWVESSPLVVGDTLYIGSSGSQIILSLNIPLGKPLGIQNTRTFNWGTPAYANDVLYYTRTVAADPREKGGLAALGVDNGILGKELWSLPVTDSLDPGLWTGVAGSPVIFDNLIVFGALDGKLYAVYQ